MRTRAVSDVSVCGQLRRLLGNIRRRHVVSPLIQHPKPRKLFGEPVFIVALLRNVAHLPHEIISVVGYQLIIVYKVDGQTVAIDVVVLSYVCGAVP